MNGNRSAHFRIRSWHSCWVLGVALLAGCGVESTEPAQNTVVDSEAAATHVIAEPTSIRHETAPDGQSVFAIDLPEDVAQLLRKSADLSSVFWFSGADSGVNENDQGAAPTARAFATVELDGKTLQLIPEFPLLAGQSYEVVFDPAAAAIETDFARIRHVYTHGGRPELSQPRIEAIYPTAGALPANHLKFYLVFSEPMQQGEEIFEHFRLVDLDANRDVPRPFRHTELWSADDRRLTLWFHPGRQKTGVNLNVEIGPILSEGRRYRLVVGGNWKSRAGVQLGDDFTHEFSAMAADHKQPQTSEWKVTAPPAGTNNALLCQLDEPLDWALLASGFQVVDSSNRLVAGEISVDNTQTTWSFTPEQPWRAGDFSIVVAGYVEDLAGNSLDRPFEVDLVSPKATPPKSDRSATLNFTVR